MSQNFWSTSIPLVAKNSPFPSKIPWNFRVVSLSCLTVVSTFTSHRFTSQLSPKVSTFLKRLPQTVWTPHIPCYSHIALPILNPLSRMGFPARYVDVGGPRWCLDHHHSNPKPSWDILGFGSSIILAGGVSSRELGEEWIEDILLHLEAMGKKSSGERDWLIGGKPRKPMDLCT